jgi:nucleoid-associated protein YgaU
MTDYSLLHVYEENQPGLFITFRMYEGDHKITGGGAGWSSVQRPQKHPLTAWRGDTDQYCMEIPLIMDTFSTSGSTVERDCRQLERMYGALTSPASQPPLLILNANGALQNDVYHFPPLRWIIPEPPTWGEQTRRNGQRVRQIVTVKFMVYAAYDEFTRQKSQNTNKVASQVIVRAGDTYSSIAARYLKAYGGARWANYLAHFNGAKDGASHPLPGQTVKLPSSAQVKQWESSPRR